MVKRRGTTVIVPREDNVVRVARRRPMGSALPGGKLVVLRDKGLKVGYGINNRRAAGLNTFPGVGINTRQKYISAPTAMSYRPGPMGRPRMTKTANGPMVVCHREYVAEIIGSAVYTSQTFNINPGLKGTFPWLSTVASNFEKYKFRYCRFAYEPESSTTSTGSVMMAIDLDVLDPVPASKISLMSIKDAQRSPPWSSCVTSLPERVAELYTRDAAITASNYDLKTYDAGLLTVATQGQASVNIVGELYVEYCVELHVPQLSPNSTLTAQAVNNQAATSTSPFGNPTLLALTFSGSNNLWAINGGNVLATVCVPGDTFLFTLNLNPTTGGPITGLALTAGVGGGAISLLGPASVSYSGTSLASNYMVAFTVTSINTAPITAPGFSSVGIYLILTITATTTANFAIGSLTMTLSPWQPALVFV
jgi:hypothetical protein